MSKALSEGAAQKLEELLRSMPENETANEVLNDLNKAKAVIVWNAEDIETVWSENFSHMEKLTPDEVELVLYLVENKHDANAGVCWETLAYWIECVLDKRKKSASA